MTLCSTSEQSITQHLHKKISHFVWMWDFICFFGGRERSLKVEAKLSINWGSACHLQISLLPVNRHVACCRVSSLWGIIICKALGMHGGGYWLWGSLSADYTQLELADDMI